MRPYHPGDLWRQVSHYGSTPATSQTYVQDHGEKLYRRSLYTYWKRQIPAVNMRILGADGRNACRNSTARRFTPLARAIRM